MNVDYPVLRHVLTGRDHLDCEILGPSPEPHGWAAEFGVWSGTSLAIIAEHMPVIGFDSFDGLPEDWREGFPQGAFAVRNGEEHFLRKNFLGPNRMVVKGLFEVTAPGFPFPPLGLVHIDCDLYSSTVTALQSVLPYIGPGTVIVFDEYHGYEGWEKHEAKAWREFCDQYRVVYNTIARGREERAMVISAIGDR